ncbi:YHB1-like protein [Saccharomyces kudriavzevii IFO 1802]|uniref:YHB1-like protein n=1 Tax=Saccharomyces kudriavzevii (strain ATCC MYA-4449 / AS 2.2408 / CBS 8840 / NBRC 1802 / NCYC 2889) TaxID=226230 RepID=J5RFE0_SACK1|nr:YHB1-like protein [Saccharomyces kudriavzevii IFO 1802]
MLSKETGAIIKSTVPVLEQQGAVITRTFRKSILTINAELLDIFNRTNQQLGEQPTFLGYNCLGCS